MESTFEEIEDPSVYTNEELSRIDYSSLRSDDFIIVDKLIRSVLGNMPIYEKTPSERAWSWFKEDETDSSSFSCLGSASIFSVRVATEKLARTGAINRLLASRFISGYIGTIPNFLRVYKITDNPVLKSHLIADPNETTTYTITQRLTSTTLQNYIGNMGWTSAKFVSYILQVVCALSYLGSVLPPTFSIGIITMSDIVLVPGNEISTISYGDIGTLSIDGTIALIANYDDVSTTIDVKGSIYVLEPRTSHIPIRQTIIEFIRNVVDYLGRGSPNKGSIRDSLKLALSDIQAADPEAGAAILSILLGRLGRVTDPNLTMKMGASYGVLSSFVPKIEGSIANDPYIHYRYAYSGMEPTTSVLISYIAKIDQLVAQAYTDCKNSIKLKKKAIVLSSFATMAALGRLVAYTHPDSDLAVQIRQLVGNNLVQVLAIVGDDHKPLFEF